MGIFRRSADWLKGEIGKSKEKSLSSRAESDKDNQKNPEVAAIAAHRSATAQNTKSIYRHVSIEALRERGLSERERAEREALFQILKARFEYEDNQKNRHSVIKWEDVQKRLEASPEKLWSLNEMERTGGEPDVVGFDEQTGEYIFFDCSPESPTGRRNLNYDQSLDLAKSMKIKILTREEYLNKLQKLGKFDRYTWSWIETLDNKSFANFGGFPAVNVFVGRTNLHHGDRGFRGSLRV